LNDGSIASQARTIFAGTSLALVQVEFWARHHRVESCQQLANQEVCLESLVFEQPNLERFDQAAELPVHFSLLPTSGWEEYSVHAPLRSQAHLASQFQLQTSSRRACSVQHRHHCSEVLLVREIPTKSSGLVSVAARIVLATAQRVKGQMGIALLDVEKNLLAFLEIAVPVLVVLNMGPQS